MARAEQLSSLPVHPEFSPDGHHSITNPRPIVDYDPNADFGEDFFFANPTGGHTPSDYYKKLQYEDIVDFFDARGFSNALPADINQAVSDRDQEVLRRYISTLMKVRTGSARGISTFRDTIAKMEIQDSESSANRLTKLPDQYIAPMLELVDRHITTYAEHRLHYVLIEKKRNPHDVSKVISELDRELGSVFADNHELKQRYELAALAKATYYAEENTHKYDPKSLKSAEGLLHMSAADASQAEVFGITDIFGDYASEKDRNRLIDILAQVNTNFDEKNYRTWEDYKQYGVYEIWHNKDGTPIFTEEQKESPEAELHMVAEWLVLALQVLPTITTQEARDYIAGKLPETSPVWKRCKYIQGFYGPKNAVPFHALYPFLAMYGKLPVNTILNMPDFMNDLTGNLKIETITLRDPRKPDLDPNSSNEYLPLRRKNKYGEFLNDAGEVVDSESESAEAIIIRRRKERDRWQQMFGMSFQELSQYPTEHIVQLAKQVDMTSYHFMFSKLIAMNNITAEFHAAFEKSKGKPLTTEQLYPMIIGGVFEVLIKSWADREQFVMQYLEYAAKNELPTMKAAEQVTEQIGLLLQEKMRNLFDLPRFRAFEQLPINITEANPAYYKPWERWRDVAFRVGGMDQAVYDSLGDDDEYNTTRRDAPLTKKQKIDFMRRGIPGSGDHAEKFMVLKAYLGCRDPLSAGSRARQYHYGEFDIFKQGVRQANGEVIPVSFDDFLRFIGMKVVDVNGEKELAVVGKPKEQAWLDYTDAINMYVEHMRAVDDNRDVDVPDAAYNILKLSPETFRALYDAANMSTNPIEALPNSPMRGKVLPPTRDRSDLYRSVVNARFTFIKYYHIDTRYGGDRLEEFQLDANNTAMISALGYETIGDSPVGDPTAYAEYYHWGDARDVYQMAMIALDMAMSPYAVRPRKEDLEALGIKLKKVPFNGESVLMMQAADDDVVDEVGEYGWVRFDRAQPRWKINRVDNVRRGRGDYLYLTKYPSEVCMDPFSVFEVPLEHIQLSAGRERAFCRALAIASLTRRGVDVTDPDNMQLINDETALQWQERLSGRYILTPRDMHDILHEMAKQELLDQTSLAELIRLHGCEGEIEIVEGTAATVGKQVSEFSRSCEALDIPDKDRAEQARATAADKTTVEQFAQIAGTLHQNWTKGVPVAGLAIDTLKHEGGRDLLRAASTGAGTLAASLVVTVSAGLNPFLAVASSAALAITAGFYARDRGEKESVYSGLSGTRAGIARLFGVRDPEMGARSRAQSMEAILGGYGRWNCQQDTSKLVEVIIKRFLLYRDYYRKAHAEADSAKSK